MGCKFPFAAPAALPGYGLPLHGVHTPQPADAGLIEFYDPTSLGAGLAQIEQRLPLRQQTSSEHLDTRLIHSGLTNCVFPCIL
jgi:hypothetical protein